VFLESKEGGTFRVPTEDVFPEALTDNKGRRNALPGLPLFDWEERSITMTTDSPYEFLIARPDWDRAVRELLTRRGSWAVGLVRRNQHALRHEFLARHLAVVPRAPEGREFLPLADWVAIAAPETFREASLCERLAALTPLPGQTLILLNLGLGPDRSGWEGCIVHRRAAQPLDAFRVVGPGMLHVRRIAEGSRPQAIWPTQTDTGEPEDRWSRTRGAVGAAVLSRLIESNVAIFGASRNGSLTAWQLAALGVRKLVLIDPDRLAVHNLNATFAFEEADVGQFKVEALAQHLNRFRSDLAVCGLPWSAADPRVVDRIRDADLLVTCVDSDAPRLLCARLATQWLKPHLDIGTGVHREGDGARTIAADVRLLLPGEGCVACVGGLRELEQAQDDLLLGPGTLPLRPAIPWHEQRAGSLVTINAMAVSAGVQLWLDLLGGDLRHSHWSRLLWQPGQGLSVDEADVTGLPDCAICRGKAVRSSIGD